MRSSSLEVPAPPPVLMLMTTFDPADSTRSRTRAYRAGSHVTFSSSSRTWIWTIAAPAAPHSIAAWAISSGVVGTFGFWAFVGHDPVVAAEMIKASRGNAVGCGLGSLIGGSTILASGFAANPLADYSGPGDAEQ